MGTFTVEDLERLVEHGCPECSSKQLEFQSYVAEVRPIQGGEPVGKPKWAHDGDDFVAGVFEATCVACDRTHFTSSLCPRCGSTDGLERALTQENAFPMLEQCPRCGTTDLSYFAFVPAETRAEGKLRAKARTDCAPDDPGFHGFRIDCRACGPIAQPDRGCALCGS